MNIDFNKDYYAALGAEKNASEDELKSLFRKASMKYHPDRQQGKSEAEKKEATERFQEINDAYEVLGDKEKRAEYDQVRAMGGRRRMGGHPFGFGMGMDDDIMNEFMNHANNFNPFGRRGGFTNAHFREKPRDPVDGQNIRIEVSLPFEDFFFGCEKTLDIKVNNRCTHCTNGIIGDKPEYGKCRRCGGNGMLTSRQGNMIMQETCPSCGGTGQTLNNRCTHCNGTSVDGTRVQTCKLEIPKFSYSGFSKTYSGVGHCGRFGGKTGDITVRAVMDKEGRFILNRDDDVETLRTVHVVPVLKALIGGTERVLTPYGYAEIEIPRCTENPTDVRVPNKGLKRRNSNDNADLMVEIHWDMPTSVTAEEKELLQKALKEMASKEGKFEAVDRLRRFDDEYAKRVRSSFSSSV